MQQRLEPRPHGFGFVAADKQFLPAGNHFAQQQLVSVGAAAGGLRQIERHLGGGGFAAAGRLHLQRQRHGFLRLQADQQAVGAAAESAGRRFEVEHDAGAALGHALAGAQVKRHARPARVVDFQPQRGKGFGAALGRDFGLLAVAFQAALRGVLAADAVAGGALAAHRFERLQQRQLGGVDALGIGACRLFHRGVAQHLHDVVLQHVSQGAGAVVKAAALFHTQRFGGGDFHRAHIIAVPQRLKHRIAKAQWQQVLQAFFAQIMVDAVDLVFAEMAADGLADGAGGRKIGAQRFFQHDAHLRRIESDRGQIGAGVGEKFGRGGKIDDNTLRLPPLHGLRQRIEIGAAGDV